MIERMERVNKNVSRVELPRYNIELLNISPSPCITCLQISM